jgi:acyl-CoA synthetase (AMP-forming)/AMP-acid ligase II
MWPSAPYLAVVAATLAAGRVACPLNTRLAPEEARRYLEPLEPSVIVADPEHAEWANALGVPVVVLLEARSRLSLRDRLRGLTSDGVNGDQPSEMDAAIVFGTGGTTGIPKAAVYTQRGVVDNMWCYAMDGKRTSTSVEVSCSPFFHVALMGPLATLFFGGQLNLLRAYDADRVLEEISAGATVVGGAAPTMWTGLRERPQFTATDRSSISNIVYGTTPSSPEFTAQLLEDYPNATIMHGFGSTETGFVSYAVGRELDLGPEVGVGRPMAGVAVRVVGDDGREVGPGEVGELAITTPWQACGYWGRPEETAATWTEAGIRIGDLGTISEQGWLRIVGRKKEMIISGGENVYPAEVEPLLRRHPRVAEAVVYGVPDSYWGERVEATVVTIDRKPIDIDELRDFARPHIAAYKLPKRVHILDELPLTSVMKVDRDQIRRIALEHPDAGVTR